MKGAEYEHTQNQGTDRFAGAGGLLALALMPIPAWANVFLRGGGIPAPEMPPVGDLPAGGWFLCRRVPSARGFPCPRAPPPESPLPESSPSAWELPSAGRHPRLKAPPRPRARARPAPAAAALLRRAAGGQRQRRQPFLQIDSAELFRDMAGYYNSGGACAGAAGGPGRRAVPPLAADLTFAPLGSGRPGTIDLPSPTAVATPSRTSRCAARIMQAH